ncbi:hypothetical protein CBS63078_2524 [Aspergillus niger]|uniref:Nascent polypeptide-associated complex subunit alpha-like UBA domain-containing protein n=3 Tax=Aspergillus TaxID=5052 RepID=A0A370PY95_ASPPH|nr:hypothetical protein ANI_1_1760184 [Aspergillus niger CBS 513.88]KAI2823038.1 hypothetical protein CBS115989_1748 [Aspergillus niger]RDH20329.1 hypothetical protein M747DRAFT_295910 [Aspergillus niger ATCC 13496]RDK47157.1 hypothetical protein M752DRAFT_272915 [Aspergillus phoenicis ATCC 13157]KAI2832913.1 hypothetical protein CBS133816_1193 [Aspergillus niger]KAI2852819.1 hypothetical protein CBS11350_452 [Aspergillus niger]|eukprot:XP_001401728.2 hypothetical protein ANI_1_1760184 [Aspergillus niger CBS 513.88]
MSDSIPSAHDDEQHQHQQHHHPTNAEDRKAAAALSALNPSHIAPDTPKSASTPSAADQEALGQAMSRLEIASGQSGGAGGRGGVQKPAEAQKRVPVEATKKKAAKVAVEDVNLLIEELELNKSTATELLRLHDGNVVEAMRAFVSVGPGL